MKKCSHSDISWPLDSIIAMWWPLEECQWSHEHDYNDNTHHNDLNMLEEKTNQQPVVVH